jgi:hypothetical protein
MFFSNKYNLLFIATPKTGTVSVHEALQKIDPDGERHKISLEDRTIRSEDTEKGILGHARARELKKVLGEEQYDKLNTFSFIRNPYSKLVSVYFFNKKNKLSQSFGVKGGKNKFSRGFKTFMTIFIAKILPFKIWALIYPYRSNSSYITDYDGKIIVDYVGRTEHLNDDFHNIMKKMGIDSKHIQLGKKNTSSHKAFEHYYRQKWFKNKMYNKMKSDVNFYEEICKTMTD